MIFNILTLAISLFASITAIIIEEHDITKILHYIQPNSQADNQSTLVIFDLDNTIMEPDDIHSRGSNQWFNAMMQNHQDTGHDYKSALNIVLRSYFEMQENIDAKLIQKELLHVLQILNNLKIPTLGLTVRSQCLADRTIEQLTSIDVRLGDCSEYLYSSLKGGSFLCYKSGVIFTEGRDKGDALKFFLKIMGDIFGGPKKIVFVDDQKKHLESVEKACNELKIDFTGIRYARLDEKVKNFKLQ